MLRVYVQPSVFVSLRTNVSNPDWPSKKNDAMLVIALNVVVPKLTVSSPPPPFTATPMPERNASKLIVSAASPALIVIFSKSLSTPIGRVPRPVMFCVVLPKKCVKCRSSGNDEPVSSITTLSVPPPPMMPMLPLIVRLPFESCG